MQLTFILNNFIFSKNFNKCPKGIIITHHATNKFFLFSKFSESLNTFWLQRYYAINIASFYKKATNYDQQSFMYKKCLFYWYSTRDVLMELTFILNLFVFSNNFNEYLRGISITHPFNKYILFTFREFRVFTHIFAWIILRQ